MTFKRLELGIAARLLGLFALVYGAERALEHGKYGLLALAVLLLVAAVWELGRHVTRGSQALADFLLAVKYRDFSQHHNEAHPNRALRPLHVVFNELSTTFRQLSVEREAQFTYLQTVLQLIDTGIISYDAEGQVESINESFKRTLELPFLKRLSTLQKRLPVLYEAISRLEPGESTVVKLTVGQKTMQLLLSATTFRLQGRAFTLVAFKNVSHTLDETEAEAWQKLLRVMTHEIMNSVAPIASLADSLRRDLSRELEQATALAPPERELLADVVEGIGIIQNRSEGLLRFSQVYRDFSTISPPVLAPVEVQELFNNIRRLMSSQLETQGIELVLTVEPADLCLQADVHLLEQVLINLVLNAAYAVQQSPQPRIELRATEPEPGRAAIEVFDNGAGIPAEVLDSIFIPFFTTRRGGTGIGLSLAKQIMHLHRGSIKVQSGPGVGTAFRLEFS
ncbi:ATP-binding protein [Hymenobacter sp. BT770]|uniref:sensor histidine kinase n=1 Tax=Hymenobacter sp. BT770 TaxID=2886942 RepID=UPI001D104738|nr:ATP-binding protein [Hymenobacter sp. BT770]MCC3153592.1 ATP-binding protein [Hymenobacter sp. BT770]MDO3415828.1 ATP-binding protein [Hymenobacter sp. BT770]